jgi:alpha-amylase
MKKNYAFVLLLAMLLGIRPASAQTTSKKIVLQAFWWDYYNDTYRFKWADYITELAPRLKSLGIDAVWIPPTPKNKNATNDGKNFRDQDGILSRMRMANSFPSKQKNGERVHHFTGTN